MNKYGFNFDNSFENLASILYTKISPQPVSLPSMVVFNEDLATELGLNIGPFYQEEGLDILSGSLAPKGASYIAQAYMGHQFAYPALLGDGRAVLLGEQIDPNGQRWDIQLKGSGPTPYSRGGDGRAALGPMLREYLISEALHALNIPSSRSLSIVLSGDWIMRRKREKGAVLSRVAQSHIRIGSFEYLARYKDPALLKELAHYAICRHYPHLAQEEDPYGKFFVLVAKNQGVLIGKWLVYGFIHGVMNTDNVLVSGQGIDYGPCAFLDKYRPQTVYSSIDQGGRYAYNQQAKIGAWNLHVLGEALSSIFSSQDVRQEALLAYEKSLQETYFTLLSHRLGIKNFQNADIPLVNEFLALLSQYNLDYNQAFLDLTFQSLDQEAYNTEDFALWRKKWSQRLKEEEYGLQSQEDFMKGNNPAIIPRNYWVEKALEKAYKGDLSLYFHFLEAAMDPFSHGKNQERYKTYEPMDNYKTYCGT